MRRRAFLRTAALGVAIFSLSASWPTPRVWEPKDPHLYYAEVVLSRGQIRRLTAGSSDLGSENSGLTAATS